MNDLIKQIVESKFNFNIDIEDNERQDSLFKSVNISKSLRQAYIDQYIVDLGLPSGTIWCKYNLGVDINLLDKAKDWYGDYYAWGELLPKNEYTCDNYKFSFIPGIKKYNNTDKLKLLLLGDDAAYLNLHNGNIKFRIPSKEHFDELLKYTNNKLVEKYNNINGLSGIIFISKTNDNELFIPVAGYYNNSKLYNVGIIARLWSSSLNTKYIDYAWYFFFDSGWSGGMNYCNRCNGMSIRPIFIN